MKLTKKKKQPQWILTATPWGFKTTKSSVPRTETSGEYFTGAIKINSGSYQVTLSVKAAKAINPSRQTRRWRFSFGPKNAVESGAGRERRVAAMHGHKTPGPTSTAPVIHPLLHSHCLPTPHLPTSPNCLSYPTTSSMISGLFIKNRSQLTLQGDAQLLLASPLRKLCICSEIFRFVFLESRTLKCHRSHGAGSVLVNAVHVRFLSGRVAAAAPQMNHRHTHTHAY